MTQVPEPLLCVWVVYGQPLDYPEHVVIRRQYPARDGKIYMEAIGGLYDDLDEARRDIPDELCCLLRHPDDDPAIIETWI